MATRLSILASGSSGNSSWLDVNGFEILIDFGLTPRTLASRLKMIGSKLESISAVVLTHIHSDHWNRALFPFFAKIGIPVYLHPLHQQFLESESEEFPQLLQRGLVKHYQSETPMPLNAEVQGLPLQVPHDAVPTFAFRFDGPLRNQNPSWSIGYLCDLGYTTPQMVEMFHPVDILALEYNHDVAMEQASGRPYHLIHRVLGPSGHLSNHQATHFFQALLERRNGRVPLVGLVQLHLSRMCNSPELAASSTQNILNQQSQTTQLITARQDQPTRILTLHEHSLPSSGASTKGPLIEPLKPRIYYQPRLPGME